MDYYEGNDEGYFDEEGDYDYSDFNQAVAELDPPKLLFTLVSQEDGSENITVVRSNAAPLSAHSSHPNYERIREGVLNNDHSVLDLFDLALAAGTKFERLTERVTVTNGWLYLDGERIDNALAAQVVRFLEEGVEDWKPLVNFFERLQANPNENSREELYHFVSKNKMSITESGLIVGYKGLNKSSEKGFFAPPNTSGTAIVDGTVFKGEINQKVGSIVEMPRSEVVYEPNYLCHIGLHVGNYSMAKGFAPHLFEVHVDPRDVVSVPTSGDKMRVCRYVVVRKIEDEITKPVVKDAKPKKQKNGSKNGNGSDPTVRVGDVYEDTDKRRHRSVKVVELLGNGVAQAKDTVTGKVTKIREARLASRKYKRVKRGKKPS